LVKIYLSVVRYWRIDNLDSYTTKELNLNFYIISPAKKFFSAVEMEKTKYIITNKPEEKITKIKNNYIVKELTI